MSNICMWEKTVWRRYFKTFRTTYWLTRRTFWVEYTTQISHTLTTSSEYPPFEKKWTSAFPILHNLGMFTGMITIAHFVLKYFHWGINPQVAIPLLETIRNRSLTGSTPEVILYKIRECSFTFTYILRALSSTPPASENRKSSGDLLNHSFLYHYFVIYSSRQWLVMWRPRTSAKLFRKKWYERTQAARQCW